MNNYTFDTILKLVLTIPCNVSVDKNQKKTQKQRLNYQILIIFLFIEFKFSLTKGRETLH